MKHPDHPSIDLGDLASLKPGNEVVPVVVNPSGELKVGLISVVTTVEASRIRTVRGPFPRVVGAYNPDTGRSLCHIYGPFSYLSANPEHLALSRKADAEEAAAREASGAALRARITQARPIAEELADDEAPIVANVLADRLTSEQIATLAGWLKLA